MLLLKQGQQEECNRFWCTRQSLSLSLQCRCWQKQGQTPSHRTFDPVLVPGPEIWGWEQGLSFLITRLQAPWDSVVPGVAGSKERNGCNCKSPSFTSKTFLGDRQQTSLVSLHLPALSIPSLKSLNLYSGSKGDPKRHSPHVDIYCWKTSLPRPSLKEVENINMKVKQLVWKSL